MRCALFWFAMAVAVLPVSAIANTICPREERLMITLCAVLRDYDRTHDSTLPPDLPTLLASIDPDWLPDTKAAEIRRDVLYTPDHPLRLRSDGSRMIALAKYADKFASGVRRAVATVTPAGEFEVETYPEADVQKAVLAAGVILPVTKPKRVEPLIDQQTASTMVELCPYAAIIAAIWCLVDFFKRPASKPRAT